MVPNFIVMCGLSDTYPMCGNTFKMSCRINSCNFCVPWENPTVKLMTITSHTTELYICAYSTCNIGGNQTAQNWEQRRVLIMHEDGPDTSRFQLYRVIKKHSHSFNCCSQLQNAKCHLMAEFLYCPQHFMRSTVWLYVSTWFPISPGMVANIEMTMPGFNQIQVCAY